MAEPKRAFEIVQDDPGEDAGQALPRERGAPLGERIGVDALMLGLGALSKRFIVALDNLFCLLTVASAFVLWHSLPDPNSFQLVGLGMYACFVLAANVIVRRK